MSSICSPSQTTVSHTNRSYRDNPNGLWPSKTLGIFADPSRLIAQTNKVLGHEHLDCSGVLSDHPASYRPWIPFLRLQVTSCQVTTT